METQTDERLVRDLYPGEVLEVGGRMFTKCRVFITTDRLIVWKLTKGVLDKVLDVAVAEPGSIAASRDAPEFAIEVATLTRGYLVNKGHGCRCRGGQLLALSPPVPW